MGNGRCRLCDNPLHRADPDPQLAHNLSDTGISYSESAPWHHRAGRTARTNAAPLIGLVILVALAVLLFATR